MSGLVSPDWLEARLGDPNVRIVETSIAKESYDLAHVPGALWVDAHADLLLNGNDSSGHVITPEQYAALMGRLGIGPDATVVWYSDGQSRFAMRGFWTMDYYGHPGGCFVLDGGRERWLVENRSVSNKEETVVRAVYPAPTAVDRENAASWQDVSAAIGSSATVILDVRTQGEYDGSDVRSARGGHIPGAVHVEWLDATAGNNVLKSTDELRALYESRGVTPDREVIAHCQLGIRASHTWFVLKHVLGYPRVKNYDGSWQEWGNRDDLPIER
jgi:thiosulfate/3-mercaptopyruvate sulfurtransferase